MGLLDDDPACARLAGRDCADLQVHAGRRVPAHVEPMVGDHVRGIDSGRVAGRLDPWHPPVGAQGLILLQHFVLPSEDHAGAGEGAGVHEFDVAEVHQVVRAVLVTGLHQHIAVQRAADRVLGQHGEVRDQPGIGRLGCAAPEPDKAVPLMQRPGPYRRAGRRAIGEGIADAGAGSIEGEAVVAADDGVAFTTAPAQGGEAVRAAVVEGCGRAVFAAIEHQGPPGDAAGQEGLPQLLAPGGHVPGVAQEVLHLILPGPVQPSPSANWPSIRMKAMRQGLSERLAQPWLVPRWMTMSPARQTVSPSSTTSTSSPSKTMP